MSGRPRAPSSRHHICASQSGAECATAAASGGRVVAEQGCRESVALAGGTAQDGVDEPRGMGSTGPLDQLDRLVDRGVIGRSVGEEQLVDAQPQAGQDGRVELAQWAVDEPLEGRVDRAAPLHGAEGEPLRLRPLAAVELTHIGRLAEGALGVGAVLECRPDRLEGEQAGGRDHSFGSGWPRR